MAKKEEAEQQVLVEVPVEAELPALPDSPAVDVSSVPEEGIIDTVKVDDYPPRPFEEAKIKP